MKIEPIASGIRIVTNRGKLHVTRPSTHVELVRAEGYADGPVVDLILEQRDEILRAHGRIALFDDLEGMTGYDSVVRTTLTEWSRVHKSEIVAFHILTRTRIAAMGVTVANLALGGHIRVHVRRESFEQALAEYVKTQGGPQSSERPSVSARASGER